MRVKITLNKTEGKAFIMNVKKEGMINISPIFWAAAPLITLFFEIITSFELRNSLLTIRSKQSENTQIV